eukprot:1667349-Rhodomonas_salina.2
MQENVLLGETRFLTSPQGPLSFSRISLTHSELASSFSLFPHLVFLGELDRFLLSSDSGGYLGSEEDDAANGPEENENGCKEDFALRQKQASQMRRNQRQASASAVQAVGESS